MRQKNLLKREREVPNWSPSSSSVLLFLFPQRERNWRLMMLEEEEEEGEEEEEKEEESPSICVRRAITPTNPSLDRQLSIYPQGDRKILFNPLNWGIKAGKFHPKHHRIICDQDKKNCK